MITLLLALASAPQFEHPHPGHEPGPSIGHGSCIKEHPAADSDRGVTDMPYLIDHQEVEAVASPLPGQIKKKQKYASHFHHSYPHCLDSCGNWIAGCR